MLLTLLGTLALGSPSLPTWRALVAGSDHAVPQDQEKVGDVIREYQDAFAEWMAAYAAATDPDRKDALVETLPRPDAYAPRLLAIVERSPRTSGAYTALAWIYGECKGRELRDAALARLVAEFGDQPRIRSLAAVLERDDAPTARDTIEQLAERSPHAEVRGAMLLARAGWWVRFARDTDRAACEAILETVIDEYPDVGLPGGTTCGEDARRRLYEVQNLLEGCLVPEIEGVGLDGEPLSLRSHRGQVVVLTFWASWCQGCMLQVPHERELVREHADRPFAMLGVNADRGEPGGVRADAARRGITWRSFRNGSAGLKGPITETWNVRTLPTTYVIGHDGRIAKRWAGRLAGPEELREAVAAALSAAESEGPDAASGGR